MSAIFHQPASHEHIWEDWIASDCISHLMSDYNPDMQQPDATGKMRVWDDAGASSSAFSLPWNIMILRPPCQKRTKKKCLWFWHLGVFEDDEVMERLLLHLLVAVWGGERWRPAHLTVRRWEPGWRIKSTPSHWLSLIITELSILPDASVLRLRSDTGAELIRFSSSQCGCFHRLRLRCVPNPSQLRQSGALCSRYAGLLFLPDGEAQPGNSAQSRSCGTGNRGQKQN